MTIADDGNVPVVETKEDSKGKTATRWTVIGLATILLGLVALGAMVSVTILHLREVETPESLLGIGSAAVGALATLLASQGSKSTNGDQK